tara:strand:+ start:932 stop:1171 length:240 start_codon:yes stop_codon:yes gene_type:complete
MDYDIELTLEEQKAIASLQRLAKKWPKSLQLFSWSGSLTLIKDNDVEKCVVGSVTGIPNDGGDPDEGFNQFSKINYLGE